MKVDTISKPFKDGSNWFIVKLEGVRDYDNSKDLEKLAAQQQIFMQKLQQAEQAWLSRIRGNAFVKIINQP